VQLERRATNSAERFFFAHDDCQSRYVSQCVATAVLPGVRLDDGRPWAESRQKRLFVSDHPEWKDKHHVVTYKWGGLGLSLKETREEVVAGQQLFVRSGTIHSAIHFAWLCGASEIAFIGCDGKPNDYEPRIENRSQGINPGAHPYIRKVQDRMCETLGLDTRYVHTESLDPVIPRIATFVWLGDKPQWVDEIVGAFAEHNPRWHTRLITQVPTMWKSLEDAVRDCRQVCQIADILYCWFLYRDGGIVMDTDSVTLRSFEPLRSKAQAWTTKHNDGHTRPTNGVMGSVPGSVAFRRALEGIEARHARMVRDDSWARCMYGPDLLREVFTDNGDQDLTMLPWHYFYPFPYPERGAARDFWTSDEARRTAMLVSISERFADGERPYAVHMWGVEGSSQRAIESGVPA
ncbi:hypothetical protein LCGC14_1484190, partial [marine sediment metagenome]